MLSSYIVWYLFLAGAGSGAYVLAAAFSLARRWSQAESVKEYGEITRGGFYLGPLLVMLGVVFLIFDLGSPEKAYRLFLSTKFTYLTFGSWTVLLFCLFATALALLRSTSLIRLPRLAFKALELFSLACALGIMAYTGMLLSSMPSIPFLNSPLVVVLLVASSLATGSALITLYGFFNQQRKSMFFGLKVIPRIDLVLIAIEILALAGLVVSKYFEGPVALASVRTLLTGEGAYVFWFGTVLMGVVVPCFANLLNRQTLHMVNQAISSVAILIGGFALRYALVTSGLHVEALPSL
ncbi:MAG: polysulfide reductase NrfD [Coriobacteriales bacterium]|jgi:formate-dependent nitrite reductase membrane component NrfD|nr:polysulfide reductase NrfD [Coriobacteriales bacterium]